MKGVILLFCLVTGLVPTSAADEFGQTLKPFFASHCVKCHGGEKVKGKVNLKEIGNLNDFLAKPELIQDLLGVIDSGDMPPEDEPQPDAASRGAVMASLKGLLQTAAKNTKTGPNPVQRLNRFQYNNTIRDLFEINRDLFALPEKLMTRETIYLNSPEMPGRVNVRSLAMNPAGGFAEVKPFPQDLRASHGFDNQANQLTLSPLLLEAFLRLSISILESPDFNENTVGVWNTFFKPPAEGADIPAETRKRIEDFLFRAFRGRADRDIIDRYTTYALKKIEQKVPFTDTMKKVASAALSSPLFLYRHSTGDKALNLATNLSYFLWASTPDEQLLKLAKSGELIKPDVLNQSINRMLADPKIERFLDTFPSQWMQLENILAATPDPKKSRYFNIDKNNPASLQMLCEPLLLFDAVFVENRPIIELIQPEFSYRSALLKDWYTSDFKVPPFDAEKIIAANRSRDEQRRTLSDAIKNTNAELDALLRPIKLAILTERRKKAVTKLVDLKPYAVWEFNGNLKDSVGSLDLKAHGKTRYEEGMVVLNKSYLQSAKLPIDLKAKTLEVWCKVHDVNQRGGGIMGIQGQGDFFDTIVLGERKPRHWISGSNGHSRTLDFPGSTPEEKPNERLHLVMVYKEDGTTTLYRNGQPYGKPYRKGAARFPKNQSSVIFGLRHLPPGGNKYLSISLARARLYNRALSAEEVAASSDGALYISEQDLSLALNAEQKAKRGELTKRIKESEDALNRVPKNQDLRKSKQDLQRRYDDEIRNKLRSPTFERVAASDPRYGGVITSAAMLSMNNGTNRTHPIARGAWIIEVIFNDPPPPPPNDVPPLNEDSGPKNLTIREKFAQHRENPDCAGCHSRLDPLGFALENFDITGRWRDKYENGRDVDASGTLLRKYPFEDIVLFKQALVKEDRRFARAFTAHLLRFALARELSPADSLTVDSIVEQTEKEDFRLRSLIRAVILNKSFQQSS
ncbi:MAG: DUF1588 domain-containing protein [Verrucomicrobiota bacterium]|nr:DUF1588 domain-containing protein [Verrucomicrobiota bacterium]